MDTLTLPVPRPGLVVRYAYLWLDEHRAGREGGTKDRPCALVLARVEDGRGHRVTVVPITHRPPEDPASAVELPATTKGRLGLDGDRSWVVLSEGNEFYSPGPDLRPVPGSQPSSVVYGALPPRLVEMLRQRFLALSFGRRVGWTE